MQSQSTQGDDLTVVGYGDGGVEVDPTSKTCLCKSVKSRETGRERFFVKHAMVGPDTGRMWNPSSPNWDPNLRAPAYRGVEPYEFRAVSKDAFELFVRYLTTKNPACIAVAERS